MTATLNTAPIDRACAIVSQLAGKKLNKVLKSAAFYTAYKAFYGTRQMQIGWIDTSLGLDITHYTNQKRNRISRAKKGTQWTQLTPKPGYGTHTPLGILITMARGKPGSNFNQLTGSRWALQHPTGGPGYRTRLGIYIRGHLTRMIKARHKSTGYLRLGWHHAMQDLGRIGLRDTGYTDILPLTGAARFGQRMGSATARQHGHHLRVTISNDIGDNSPNPPLAKRRQEYWDDIGLRALNLAIAQQAMEMRNHYLPRATAELAQAWQS